MYDSGAESVLELLYRIIDDKEDYQEKLKECQKMHVTTLSEYLGSYKTLYEKILQESEPERNEIKAKLVQE